MRDAVIGQHHHEGVLPLGIVGTRWIGLLFPRCGFCTGNHWCVGILPWYCIGTFHDEGIRKQEYVWCDGSGVDPVACSLSADGSVSTNRQYAHVVLYDVCGSALLRFWLECVPRVCALYLRTALSQRHELPLLADGGKSDGGADDLVGLALHGVGVSNLLQTVCGDSSSGLDRVMDQ